MEPSPASSSSPGAKDTASPANRGAKPTHKLSCTACRSRKIKCDKTYPCGNCTKAGMGCVFPARKRMERPKKHKNTELLTRISRLESIVGKVNVDSLEDEAMADEIRALGGGSDKTKAPSYEPLLAAAQGLARGAQESAPLPAVGQRQAQQYMSDDFWANLCNEVEGLKQALERSSDNGSDDDDSDSLSTEPVEDQGASAFALHGLLASVPSGTVQKASLPPPSEMCYLVGTYFQNVDMLLKIIHKPSFLRMIDPQYIGNLSKSQTALVMAVLFAASCSIYPLEDLSRFGAKVTRESLRDKYRAMFEQALNAADYLNNTDLECLQALAIYVGCVRTYDTSRASWVLVALLIRLAQAIELSRDGDGSKFPPYEAEMRRRLWWQLVVLDVRAAEDRGTEVMIAMDSYNTRLPLNLNDDDFGPETPGPLIERIGPTDLTFSRCTAESSDIYLYVCDAQARLTDGTPMQSEEDIIKHAQRLEANYITNADTSNWIAHLASDLSRMIILKLWLIMQYPLHPPTSPNIKSRLPGPKRPPAKVSRETILQTATSVMELQAYAAKGPYAERWAWWGHSYPQWHPLAVCLAELCTQTRGPLVERAWKLIEVVFPEWGNQIADNKRGTLWRPIRKLYKKAKAAWQQARREDGEKMARSMGLSGGVDDPVVMLSGPGASFTMADAATKPEKVEDVINVGQTPAQPQQQPLPTSALDLDSLAIMPTDLDLPMETMPVDWSTFSFDNVAPMDEQANWQGSWGGLNDEVWAGFVNDTYTADGASRTGSSTSS